MLLFSCVVISTFVSHLHILHCGTFAGERIHHNTWFYNMPRNQARHRKQQSLTPLKRTNTVEDIRATPRMVQQKYCTRNDIEMCQPSMSIRRFYFYLQDKQLTRKIDKSQIESYPPCAVKPLYLLNTAKGVVVAMRPHPRERASFAIMPTKSSS